MKHKIIIAIISVLFVSTPVFAATVSIPDKKAVPGATINVPVNIDDSSGIAGFQFTVAFDSAVLQAEGVSAGTLTDGWMILVNTEIPGEARVVGLNDMLNELDGTAGTLANLVFLVTGGIKDSTDMTFSEYSFNNALSESIAVTVMPGNFTADVMAGDINGDGMVNISDVILCLRMAVELDITIGGITYPKGEYPPAALAAADINEDGTVNISDVILVLRIAIGLD